MLLQSRRDSRVIPNPHEVGKVITLDVINYKWATERAVLAFPGRTQTVAEVIRLSLEEMSMQPEDGVLDLHFAEHQRGSI
jgi:hypothetical protein